jgi:glyoxylase-like metal-dependent hydrolase (beta-lactamase superfamily II)/8-oxo-dGTP pyrophosphatase MutT (NUDIX family)
VPETRAVVAAVTILYRLPLEIFWVRRAPTLQFLGGFWGFPGGRVEPSDRSVADAGARELREETGVVVPSSHLVPAGRTVTPEWAEIRFDAHYFLVAAPDGAAPDVACSGGELVAGEWIAPAEALARWSRGERLTSPVIVAALRTLAAGLDRAPERLAEAFAALARGGRAWELAPDLAMASLRSPTLLPATHTNCFIVGADDVIVIDPGSPYPEEQAALDAALAGRRVREIWATHHHFDHVGGAEHLRAATGAPLCAHPRTADLLHALGVRVDRVIADGEVAAAGARRLRAVFTPGHTPGHHCFLDETTGFVMAGDMVAGTGTVVIDPGPDEGDMAEYLRSIARMEALSARALLPAHGPILTEPAAKLDEYRRHRMWREERVVAALARLGEATPADLTVVAYDDVPPSVHPLAERSLRAHLTKLVKEGRAREREGRFRPSST